MSKDPERPGSRAFEELLSEHLDALYRVALRLCRSNHADAEDLLQESALRAFEGFQSLRDPGSGRAWLFTILSRTHLNRIRSARRRPELSQEEMTEAAFQEALAAWSPPATPWELTANRELGQVIARAIDALPDELRSVVVLMDIEGFRQREAASMLEVPEGTVASRLFRARRQLRDQLVEAAVQTRKWRAR